MLLTIIQKKYQNKATSLKGDNHATRSTFT